MSVAPDAHAKKKSKKKRNATKTITQTFSGGGFTIPSSGNANPYPSQTNVAINKLKSGVLDLNVKLTGFSHTFEDDVDMMLVAPTNQCAIILSDAGATILPPTSMSPWTMRHPIRCRTLRRFPAVRSSQPTTFSPELTPSRLRRPIQLVAARRCLCLTGSTRTGRGSSLYPMT
jgi:hypothetical protein